MKIKFDKEKAKEWGVVIKDVAWHPDVMLLTGMFGGVALTKLIYLAADWYKRATMSSGKLAYEEVFSDIWDDMPEGVYYQAFKISPENTLALLHPLFFLISDEDRKAIESAE